MPSLALVVEGPSDYFAVPILLKAAGAIVCHKILFKGQGVQCSVQTLVQKRLLSPTRSMILKEPSKVLVIIDRETRPACPGEFAQRVEAELVRQLRTLGYAGVSPVHVICADRSLENWLVADQQGILRSVPARVRNRADGHDAVAIIERAYGTRHYHKTRDAPLLAAKVRVHLPDVRRRSKSLDKLLRQAGV